MKNQELEKKIEIVLKERMENGALQCEVAQKIAKDLGVEKALVGKIASKLDIKLKNCQLGCF